MVSRVQFPSSRIRAADSKQRLRIIRKKRDQMKKPELYDKEYRKRLKRVKSMKTSFFITSLLGQNAKMKWLRKKKVFAMLGDNVLYQPNTIPNEPGLVKIHNNVRIAAKVTFYTHDVINMMFQTMDQENYIPHRGCIEIHDNCFIGGNSILIGDVSIGPDAIVAAGSVVTKDVEPGTIVGGNPARVIGSFERLHQKRRMELGSTSDIPTDEQLWERFYNRKNNTRNDKVKE